MFTLAITGLLGIGYEVLVVRVFSQVTENTLFTFAILLAVYLVGTALGAAAYARWRGGAGADMRDRSCAGQVLACLLGIAALTVAAPMTVRIARDARARSRPRRSWPKARWPARSFCLPTLVMGALFSHLVTLARHAGASFGKAVGVNTLAAACAPVVFGVWLLPTFGTTLALLVVAAGYLRWCATGAHPRRRRRWRRPPPWCCGDRHSPP